MNIFEKHAPLIAQYKELLGSGANPLRVCMERVLSATEAIIDGHPVILAGTNNYLGLTFDPDCIAAARDTIARDGTGTTGSRIANGTYADHLALEEELAAYLGRRAAIVFTTGYQANLGALCGLVGAKDYLFIDADSHASIYDGCRLSGATVIRFKHNDADDLARRLARVEAPDAARLIVVEGIYSMLGDRAPLAELVEVKRQHDDAYLMVDEAHSLGVLGATGRGLAEEAGVESEVDFVVGTFSKSLGAIGGFCASDHPEFEILRVASRPFMFTASPPSSIVASVRRALAELARDPGLKDKLWRNARALHDGLSRRGVPLCSGLGPIVAVLVPGPREAIAAWRALLDAGVYVNLAIPPGTPSGQSLLRCSVSAAHSEAQIEAIRDALISVTVGSRVSAA